MLASYSSQHLESHITPQRNPHGFHQPMNRSSPLEAVAKEKTTENGEIESRPGRLLEGTSGIFMMLLLNSSPIT